MNKNKPMLELTLFVVGMILFWAFFMYFTSI